MELFIFKTSKKGNSILTESQAKRIKLTCKTSASSTVYGNAQPQGEGEETKRSKKRAFDYDEVNKVANEEKRHKAEKFHEVSRQQSHVSIRTEPQVEEGGSQKQGGAWANVHPTHKRYLLNGILFCARCGKYSIAKTEGLAIECPGQPYNSYGRVQLKKLLNGQIPIRSAETWPDGSSARVRYTPIEIDRF